MQTALHRIFLTLFIVTALLQFQFNHQPTYKTTPHWSGEILTPFEVDKLLATIVYSAESLIIFDRQISDAVRHLPLLVPSSRVAGIARERGFTRVFAVQPKDEALIGQLVDLKN